MDRLCESLGDTTCYPLSSAWQTEIERRCRELDQGATQLVPADQVLRDAEDLLRRTK